MGYAISTLLLGDLLPIWRWIHSYTCYIVFLLHFYLSVVCWPTCFIWSKDRRALTTSTQLLYYYHYPQEHYHTNYEICQVKIHDWLSGYSHKLFYPHNDMFNSYINCKYLTIYIQYHNHNGYCFEHGVPNENMNSHDTYVIQ